MSWLGFSRTEANGFLILIPLMIVMIISQPVYNSFFTVPQDFSKEEALLDSIYNAWQHTEDRASVTNNSFAFFDFDPNKVSVEDLEKLGFKKKLSKRIANYRQKGGVFRIKRDLMNIYGMDSTLYHQLYTHILLPETIQHEVRSVSVKKADDKKIRYDINSADTSQLKKIYGIGDKLAMRILKFRDGLGGFISMKQISEVYGLDSAVILNINKACFIDETFKPKKVNINTKDEKTLNAHPYVKKPWVKAIFAYRFQHGDFTDVRDLLNVSAIPPHEAEKLIPYLDVKD